MIIYWIKASVGLTVFLICFWALFRNDKWFEFNRYYLLFAMGISLLFPLVDWGFYWETSYTFSNEIVTALEHGSGGKSINSDVVISESTSLTTSYMDLVRTGLLVIYLTVSSLFLVRFIRNLVLIAKKITNGLQLYFRETKLILTDTEVTPQSFMNYIIVNKDNYESGLIDQEILTHEEAHCKQLHSLDILITELLIIFFWWHPIIWIYRDAIKVNHEYLADQTVVLSTPSVQEYAHKIIMANHTAKTHLPVSFFNLSLTKNRIVMLTKKNKSSIFLFSGKAMAVSIVTFLTCALLAFSNVQTSNELAAEEGEFVVVIDPGHGAHDPGTQFGDLSEKDIVLEISKRLELSKDLKGVKLIFTRDNDKFVALNERADFSKNEEVDFLLSIHVNTSKNENIKGTEIYFSPSNEHKQESLKYGQILANQMTYRGNAQLLVADNLYLLRESKCPSVLLQVGFLSNQEDRQGLGRDKMLDKIAKDINKALVVMSKL